MNISAGEWDRRSKAFVPPKLHYTRGYGRLFLEHVTQADKGCDFDFSSTIRLAGLGGATLISLRPRLRKASRSEGFVMKQLAPSFSAVLRSRGESEDVKTTTGTWAYAGVSRRHFNTSPPSLFGRFRSNTKGPDQGISELPSTLNVFEGLLPVGHNQ